MKRLIVTADDVGLDRGMTAGAIRAHREGIVTACSIVANGREFDDAVARLRDTPSLEAGVHLTLVEEESLTGIELPKSWKTFFPAYVAGRIKLPRIIDELRAQIEKVLGTGLRITHVNSHQHLHALRQIFAVVLQLSSQYEIGYVRRVHDFGGQAGRMRRAAVNVLNRIGRTAPGNNDRTIGVMEAGHLTRIEPLLQYVEGVTELVTHPGIGVAGYAQWNYDWEGELRALCDPELRNTIARYSIELAVPGAV
ncbi:MAG TPA: ChbG/HpnK family deacetylase [Thermoanaerobaculia bacterium]|nr:ChbG/HpnK family deacetylase [Thermoanaerobaculia bacterium]